MLRRYPQFVRPVFPGRLWAVAALVWVVYGCQSTTRVGDRFYENGRYPEAAAAFQALLESDTADRDLTIRTCYRLGVIFATPGSSVYDPQRSIDTFDRLIYDYPDSTYAAEAALLRDLQLEIRDLHRVLTRDGVRLAELEVDLAESESELASLAQQLSEKDQRIQALQESIPLLRLEIRSLIRELASKEQDLEQLERLKAIDLDQPPP